MLILGQLGSGEPSTAGRTSSNRDQENVRQDKRETDCIGLVETAQAEIVVPNWIALHGGDGEDAPQLVLRSLRGRALRELAASAKDFAEGGYRLDEDCIQRETGIPMTEIEID